MPTLDLIQEVIKDATAVIGSLSLLFTALSHLPLPARSAEFFARLGLTTAKFSVNKRPTEGPVAPL